MQGCSRIPYHAELISQVALHYLDRETVSKQPLEQKMEESKRYLNEMMPGFLDYLKNRQEMTTEIKEEIIHELSKDHFVTLKCRNPAVVPKKPLQDPSKRAECASFILHRQRDAISPSPQTGEPKHSLTPL